MLNQTEKCPILKVLVLLAKADKDYPEAEKAFIQNKAEQFGFSDIPSLSSADSLESLLALIKSQEAKETLLTFMVQLSFADGVYDSRERWTIRAIAKQLGLEWSQVEAAEFKLVKELEKALAQAKAEEKAKKQKEEEDSGWGNFGKIAGTALLGGAALALTGGLAAPLIGGAIGTSLLGLSGAAATSAGLALLGGGSLAAGGLGMAGGTAVVCTALGLGGAGIAGWKASHLHGEIEEWDIERIGGQGLHVQVGISGWLQQNNNHQQVWKSLPNAFPQNSNYVLAWESKTLHDLGSAFRDVAAKGVMAKGVVKAALSATSKAVGMAALPLTILSALEIIDNPWAVAKNRSEQAGKLLGDYIADNELGGLPVTLVGYSLGANVVLAALERLHERNETGKIYNVYFLAGAVSQNDPRLKYLKTIVSGQIVNVYSQQDLILSYVYRTAELFAKPVGISPLKPKNFQLRNCINLDVTDSVGGHLDYLDNFDRIFTEIKRLLNDEYQQGKGSASQSRSSDESQAAVAQPQPSQKQAQQPQASQESVEKFRKLVAACYVQGEPDQKEIALLEKFRLKYGLSPDEAQAIIAEFQPVQTSDPYTEYKNRYRELLLSSNGIGLEEQAELLELQEELGISNGAVNQIEEIVKGELEDSHS